MANLNVDVAGIHFPNPIMPAAGPPVRDARSILRCAEGGAGGLVAKTISTRAATPPTPNIAEIPHGMVNTELWSELPPEQWIEREYPAAMGTGLPFIVSLGYSAEDIASLAPRIRPFADAVELSTHYIGEDAEPMVAAIRAAKAALDVPVFVKLSPLGREMVRAAEQAEAAGADGIVAINSFGPVLAIDPDTRRPYLGGSDGYGWLSGPSLKPLALRCVRDISRAVTIPVIGVGGVTHGIDAVEMLMAGASAVQVLHGRDPARPGHVREDRPRTRRLARRARHRDGGRAARRREPRHVRRVVGGQAGRLRGTVQRLRHLRAGVSVRRDRRSSTSSRSSISTRARAAACASRAADAVRSSGYRPSLRVAV